MPAAQALHAGAVPKQPGAQAQVAPTETVAAAHVPFEAGQALQSDAPAVEPAAECVPAGHAAQTRSAAALQALAWYVLAPQAEHAAQGAAPPLRAAAGLRKEPAAQVAQSCRSGAEACAASAAVDWLGRSAPTIHVCEMTPTVAPGPASTTSVPRPHGLAVPLLNESTLPAKAPTLLCVVNVQPAAAVAPGVTSQLALSTSSTGLMPTARLPPARSAGAR